MSLFIKKTKRSASVNIVPLVDVLIILLFFFVISTENTKHLKTLSIILPKMHTAGPTQAEKSIFISIDENEQLFLDQQPIGKEQLVEALGITASLDKETPIVILADERSQVQSLTFVMDSCRKCGLEKINLQTR